MMKLIETVNDMYELLKKRAREGDREAYEIMCRIEEKTPEQLKPCPFCGGQAEAHKDENEEWIHIRCSKCWAETDGCDSLENAIEFWNKRTAMLVKCPRCGAELTLDDTE